MIAHSSAMSKHDFESSSEKHLNSHHVYRVPLGKSVSRLLGFIVTVNFQFLHINKRLSG